MSAHPIISYINISRPIRYYRISRPRLAEPIISDICQIRRSRYYRSGYAERSAISTIKWTLMARTTSCSNRTSSSITGSTTIRTTTTTTFRSITSSSVESNVAIRVQVAVAVADPLPPFLLNTTRLLMDANIFHFEPSTVIISCYLLHTDYSSLPSCAFCPRSRRPLFPPF